ncbi:DUF2190 family protein [bacterium]|nr:DUF2190 family protein [bacterium]
MAVMQSRDTRSMVAGHADGVSQFKFVKLGTNATHVVACGNGQQAFGVALNTAAQNNSVTVAVTGKVMIEAGATVTANGAIASDADGNCVNAASTDIIMGYAMEAGVDGQIIAIELIQGGNAAA